MSRFAFVIGGVFILSKGRVSLHRAPFPFGFGCIRQCPVSRNEVEFLIKKFVVLCDSKDNKECE